MIYFDVCTEVHTHIRGSYLEIIAAVLSSYEGFSGRSCLEASTWFAKLPLSDNLTNYREEIDWLTLFLPLKTQQREKTQISLEDQKKNSCGFSTQENAATLGTWKHVSCFCWVQDKTAATNSQQLCTFYFFHMFFSCWSFWLRGKEEQKTWQLQQPIDFGKEPCFFAKGLLSMLLPTLPFRFPPVKFNLRNDYFLEDQGASTFLTTLQDLPTDRKVARKASHSIPKLKCQKFKRVPEGTCCHAFKCTGLTWPWCPFLVFMFWEHKKFNENMTK